MSAEETELGMLVEARSEVGTADHKASMVLTALGVGFGALLAAVVAGDWSPDELAGLFEWLWWVGAALAAGSVVAAALAVWPRWDEGETFQHPHYWGHVARYESVQDLAAALDQGDVEESDRTRSQLWKLSQIVALKYTWVRRAFLLAGSSAIPLLVSGLLG